MSNYRKTVKTIFAVVSITLLAKFMGFFRDALLGSKLGANMESDAYLMALNSTSIIFVSIGSAIVTAAIPTIVELLTKRGKEAAFAFINKLLNILIILSTTIVAFGIFFSKNIMGIIASGFDEEKLNLTAQLTQTMFPILICICITYVFVAMLQSLEKFKVTSIISFPANIAVILYLYFFSQQYGVQGLAIMTLVGWTLQFGIQIPFLYKEGYRYRFALDLQDESVKKFFRIIIPIVIVASVNQINMLLDEKQASFLEHGRISILYYANMLYQAIATTTVFGISTVMFPKFAEKAVNLTQKQYARFVTAILSLMIFLLLPMITGIILLRNPIIRIVFERGAFQYHTTLYTGLALGCYATGMLGFGMQDVINKAFYARNDIKSPVRYAILIIGLNIIFNLILVKRFDIAGLAIATALASTLGGIGLLGDFQRKIGHLEIKKLMITFLKTLICSFLMGVMVMLSTKILRTYFPGDDFIHKMIVVIVPSMFGGIVYAFITIQFKIEEALMIYNDFVKPMFAKLKNN
ncbi:murein biosynthesis integral membrane protein MurJ [Clostridiaceae bacterium 35-E11]